MRCRRRSFAAWRALDRFEGRASLRSWLFGIATNVCLDMLKARRRRALPMELAPPSPGDAPLGAALPEHLWVGPIHDDRVLPANGDPAEVAVARESIRLAFVAALQLLTPKQRAALILRDVLRWKTNEVAALLDMSIASVESLVAPRSRGADNANRPATRSAESGAARGLIDRYVEAFERYDVDALVALLHEDVTLSMPPHPLWLRGIDAVRTWLRLDRRRLPERPLLARRRQWFAWARRVQADGPDGRYEAFGIQVIEQSEAQIIGIHAFLDPKLFALFGIPLTLAGQTAAVE